MINFSMFEFFRKDTAIIQALKLEKECFIRECRDYESTQVALLETIKNLNKENDELMKLTIPVVPTNFNVFDFAKMNAFSIEIVKSTTGTVTVIGFINPTGHVKEWNFHWGEYHNKADHLRLVAEFNMHMNKVSLAK